MDSHAQYEIRKYAETIGYEIVAKWCPIAWEAFLDYRVNSSHLTRLEMEVLLAVTQNDNTKAVELAKKFGWIKEDGSMKKNREREEVEEKFKKMGIKLPWQ